MTTRGGHALLNVEVCSSQALVSVGKGKMAQQNDPNGFAPPPPFGATARQAALAPAMSADRTPDPVAIFTAPDVVFHWWAESKRRWAEQNRLSPLLAHPADLRSGAHVVPIDSDSD